MLQSEHYLGKNGEKYFQWQNKGEIIGKIEARKFQKYIKVTDVVLDFGCGNGSTLNEINAFKKLGIEINPSAVAEIANNYRNISIFPKVENIESNYIDKIFSNHALEHTLDPFAILQNFHRILKNDGLIILCLPINDWRNERQYKGNDINNHLYTWTPLLIGNLLKEAGFNNIESFIYTHAWPKNWQKWFNYNQKIFDLLAFFSSIRKKRRQLFAIASK